VGKPLNEFGGWLSFFRIIVMLSFMYISIICLLIFILFIVDAFMQNLIINKENVSSAIRVFFGLMLAAIQFQIVKGLKTQSSIAPDRISKLCIFDIALNMTSFGLGFVMYKLNMLPASANINNYMRAAIAGSIIPLLLLAYLRRSKRVKAYYGANAFE
jgi:hypothetical protein